MSIVLDYCPECSGVGTIEDRECGVCCGDLLIWPDDASKPGWLHDRFQDHSRYDHRCDRCQRPPGMVPGAERIAIERDRQIDVEGYTPVHDAQHGRGSLALAAAVYALPDKHRDVIGIGFGYWKVRLELGQWLQARVGWDPGWFKPSPDDRVRELEKAGALIAAEIDRLQQRQAVPA